MANVNANELLIAAAKAILEAAGETAGAKAAVQEQKAETKKAAAPAKKAEAKAEAETDDLNSKTTKELYQMCIDAGIQVPKYGKTKQFYMEQLQGGAAEADTDVEDEAVETEDDGDEYSTMSAKELFNLCNKRKIKVAPKKTAEYYADMLRKADEAKAKKAAPKKEEVEEDDDWGDEEEKAAEEKPAKKKAAAPAKKATVKKEEEAEDDEDEDDDDDWDI